MSEQKSQQSNPQKITRLILNLRKKLEKFQITTQKKMIQFVEYSQKKILKISTQSYLKLITTFFSSYFIADIAILIIIQNLPQTKKTKNSFNDFIPSQQIISDDNIFSRNLFNSEGLIPGDLSNRPKMIDPNGTAVKTTLPFQLIGTLILQNGQNSIATLQETNTSLVYPMSVYDELPNKIKILKIEPNKVTFVNLINNEREYLEMQNEDLNKNRNLRFGSNTHGIEKINTNHYAVSRIEVDRAFSDLNQILTQAHAVPNFENGNPNGYKLFQIVPGSIYDKLGLQNGDIIASINGTSINDPSKAFEMLSELRTANHLELQIKKDGRMQTYSYDIH